MGCGGYSCGMTQQAEREELAKHLMAWAEVGGPDDLYNTRITTPSGGEIVVPMHIGAAVAIEEEWPGWHIECF